VTSPDLLTDRVVARARTQRQTASPRSSSCVRAGAGPPSARKYAGGSLRQPGEI
jgi:hypothetical protein